MANNGRFGMNSGGDPHLGYEPFIDPVQDAAPMRPSAEELSAPAPSQAPQAQRRGIHPVVKVVAVAAIGAAAWWLWRQYKKKKAKAAGPDLEDEEEEVEEEEDEDDGEE